MGHLGCFSVFTMTNSAATTTHMHTSLCTCMYFGGLPSSVWNCTGQRCIYILADGANLLQEAYSVGEGPPDFSWVMGPFENTMKAFASQSWKTHISTISMVIARCAKTQGSPLMFTSPTTAEGTQ